MKIVTLMGLSLMLAACGESAVPQKVQSAATYDEPESISVAIKAAHDARVAAEQKAAAEYAASPQGKIAAAEAKEEAAHDAQMAKCLDSGKSVGYCEEGLRTIGQFKQLSEVIDTLSKQQEQREAEQPH